MDKIVSARLSTLFAIRSYFLPSAISHSLSAPHSHETRFTNDDLLKRSRLYFALLTLRGSRAYNARPEPRLELCIECSL